MESLIQKYKTQAETLLQILSVTEDEEEASKIAACRRFVVGILNDLKHLEEQDKFWMKAQAQNLDMDLI